MIVVEVAHTEVVAAAVDTVVSKDFRRQGICLLQLFTRGKLVVKTSKIYMICKAEKTTHEDIHRLCTPNDDYSIPGRKT